jgi:hypothetical protein
MEGYLYWSYFAYKLLSTIGYLGKAKGGTKVNGRRGIRSWKLVDDLKERRG